MKKPFYLIAILTLFILSGCQTIPEAVDPRDEISSNTYIFSMDEDFPSARIYDTNILDYLVWRGDISFKQEGLNEIDAIIFAQLTYIHFNGIISDNLTEQKTLEQVAIEFKNSPDYEIRKYNGPFINPDTITLLMQCAVTERFKNVKLCYFIDELDDSTSKQFSAFTAFLEDGTTMVCYRGTHTEIVGWKEDFEMAYEIPVPAQTRSVEYLEEISKNHKNLIIVGHSKAGNLALYAGAFCTPQTQKKIKRIYNFDGQGFDYSIVNDNHFDSIKPIVKNFAPQSSVVGMIFDSVGEKTIIRSTESKLLYQHDPFSWTVRGNRFIRLKDRTEKSYKIEKKLDVLLNNLTLEQRKNVVKGLFGIFEASGAKTLEDFQDKWLINSPEILRYLARLDQATKQDLLAAIKILVHG